MKKYSNNFITLADLYLAYKKAKVESFYDGNHPTSISFAKYEENLDNNLKKLQKKLQDKETLWHLDKEYLGNSLYMPKSINTSNWQEKSHYVGLDPFENWSRQFDLNNKKKLETTYRLVIDASVNFHIISSLWILKVGHLFEEKLNKNFTYGNRLRRYKEKTDEIGEINTDTLGLFQPYFSAYKKWREKGLDTMKISVEKGLNIHAITMDLSRFYHNVSPNFILAPTFLKIIGVTLDTNSKLLTEEIISAMNTWYKYTPDYDSRTEGALPVGLSASKIISNILLYEFDKQINEHINPLYYGRYVDDIFLVINSPQEIQNAENLMNWITTNIPCLQKNNDSLTINFQYSLDSTLIFGSDKQKIFYLSSEHGLDLINNINKQIKLQSSEYRLLANLPDSTSEMAARALLSTADASLEADALRKTDVVSIKRLGFSLLLKDIESYAKDLKSSNWKDLRVKFYTLINRYLLAPSGIFDYTGYYNRIFSIMIACNDLKEASEFIDNLIFTFQLLEETTDDKTDIQIKFNSYKQYMVKVLIETAFVSSTVKGFEEWTKLGRIIRKLQNITQDKNLPSRRDSIKKLSNTLLIKDLGKRPYKEYWYYSQTEDAKDKDIPKRRSIQKILKLASIRYFREAANLKIPHWKALTFPTRPLTLQEIILIIPETLHNRSLLKRAILGLRGAGVKSDEIIGFSALDETLLLNIPNKIINKQIIVALTSYKTEDKQWEAVVKGTPDRSVQRYSNLTQLINKILKEKNKINYITFPECSIPRRWAFSIAYKLAQHGISLICGLEYYSEPKIKGLKNDSLLSLVTDWPGYKTNLIYLQSKLKPALAEKKYLTTQSKKLYEPPISNTNLPIYKHGEFYFGLLICSDLTNILNRSFFQGKIDGLFILEWNSDIETFNSLIESTAYDLHSFVIQINNRTYGDSRIRVPFKESYKRDLIRVKGGISDFYVLGSINFDELRRFQRQKKSSLNPKFKPLPIGYEVSRWRKRKTNFTL
ncbi:RNA-directed DNA polymerase [Arcobacter sp. F2176]|uniref:RNA-directed DNA polymerase n=1 Tax=Arcobacter sp. F2176 TaxID=2044511 RepID=UPI00100A84A5|nr:RNA-directed DNA polymerase [Arcobacter sp. F2176]RXJ81036.1 hypothetical protein CRU95_08950 [Arcobacter sp. F2176]